MTYEIDANNLQPVEHSYNEEQQGKVSFVKVPDGLEIHVVFINDKLIDGDHYRCDTYLLDAGGAHIAAAKIKAGVNARGTGGVNERPIDEKIPLTADELARLTKIIVDFGQFDEVDDTELWKKLAKEVAKYYFGDAVAPA